jgi:hypothetical protein
MEHMYLDVFKSQESVANTAESYIQGVPNLIGDSQGNLPGVLCQPASIAVPSTLPSKLTDPKGNWVQQALDVLMVHRAVERARSTWLLLQLVAPHDEPR